MNVQSFICPTFLSLLSLGVFVVFLVPMFVLLADVQFYTKIYWIFIWAFPPVGSSGDNTGCYVVQWPWN